MNNSAAHEGNLMELKHKTKLKPLQLPYLITPTPGVSGHSQTSKNTFHFSEPNLVLVS